MTCKVVSQPVGDMRDLGPYLEFNKGYVVPLSYLAENNSTCVEDVAEWINEVADIDERDMSDIVTILVKWHLHYKAQKALQKR